MKRFIAGIALVVSFASAAIAQETPDALVRNVSEEVLAIVKNDKDLQSGNTKRAMELVEAKVLPHFNFNRMTRLALGREWNKASEPQKEQLVKEFRTLLVRTYSNALTEYKNQTIEYKPFRMAAGDTDVMVKTQVNQPGAKPITLDYWLEKLPEGWKVYDVVVASVSLVTNYRDTFAQEVRNGGIDGLIKTLAAKNAKTVEKKG